MVQELKEYSLHDDLIQFLKDNIQNNDIINNLENILNKIRNISEKEFDTRFKSELSNKLKIANLFSCQENNISVEDEIIKSINSFHEKCLLNMCEHENKSFEFEVKQFKIHIELILAAINAMDGNLISGIKDILKSIAELNFEKSKSEIKSLTLKNNVYYYNENKGIIEFVSLRFTQNKDDFSIPFFSSKRSPVKLRFLYYKGDFNINEIKEELNLG